MAKIKTNPPASIEPSETPVAIPPKMELSQRIADALGRGRLVVEQGLDATDSWAAAEAMVAKGDFDSVRLLLDGEAKAT